MMRLLATAIIALILTGCASDPQVVAVKTPIAQAPAACRTQPKAVPVLPDREMEVAELAKSYNRLKRQYLSEAGRLRLCQKYVGRLTSSE